MNFSPQAVKGEIIDKVGIKYNSMILNYVIAQFNIRSKGGSDADGVRWSPLKPKTIKSKRGTFGANRILIRTGILKASITSKYFKTTKSIRIYLTNPQDYFDHVNNIRPIFGGLKELPEFIERSMEKFTAELTEKWMVDKIRGVLTKK
jgi:hypothetical protein